MSLYFKVGLAVLFLLPLLILVVRSIHKGYEKAEEKDDYPTMPPPDESTIIDPSVSEFHNFGKRDDDTPAQPVTLHDLDTAPPGR